MKPGDSGEAQPPHVPQAQEEGAEIDSEEQQQQKLVTLHVAEPGDTVQEAYEEVTLGGSELQQITVPFGGTAEYSIIAPVSAEAPAPGALYRLAVCSAGRQRLCQPQVRSFSGGDEANPPDTVLSCSEGESPAETCHAVVVSDTVMAEEALKDQNSHYIVSSGAIGTQFPPVEVRS